MPLARGPGLRNIQEQPVFDPVMKTLLNFVLAALLGGGWAAAQEGGRAAYPVRTALTAAEGSNAAGQRGWKATAKLWFTHPEAKVTKWSEPVRDGRVTRISFEAVQPLTEIAADPPVLRWREFWLGELPAGEHRLVLSTRGRTLEEKVFQVGSPPAGEVKADVTLKVDAADPSRVRAHAHVEFRDHYVITEKHPVKKDAAGRYVLGVTVEPAAVIAIYPPPPPPVEDVFFELGAVPPGEHVAVFQMNGRTYAETRFTVREEPREPEANVSLSVKAGTQGPVARVRIELPDPYWAMEDPGTPQRDGGTVKIFATLVPIQTIAPLPSPGVIEREYPLGPLPAGDYRLIFHINGRAKAETTFQVGSPPPPPPDPEAKVTGRVEPTSSGLKALVRIELPNPHYELTDRGAPVREGPVVRINATLTALDAQVARPAPKVIELAYGLDPLPEGEYRLHFLINGRLRLEVPFRVGQEPPHDLPAQVSAQVDTTASGVVVARVRVELPNPYFEMTDPGRPERDGRHVRINATFTAADAARPAPGPKVIEQDYELGVLPAGDYRLLYQINGRTRLEKSFRVGGPPPPPRDAELTGVAAVQREGEWRGVIELMLMPDVGLMPMQVRREGRQHHVEVELTTLGRPRHEDDRPRPVRAEVALGVLEAGSHVFSARLGEVVRKVEFTVGAPPPPPVQPLVAYLQPIVTGEEWQVEAALAFTRPDWEVKSWGVPVREGRRFHVEVVAGPRDPAGPATGPPAPEEPAALAEPLLERFREIGGSPLTLVRHRYRLGVLPEGEHVFVLRVNGQELARRAWTAGAGGGAPVFFVTTEPIETAGGATHEFQVVFHSPAGWDGDASRMPVVVRGPHGFEAAARLLECIPSMDPLGRMLACRYAVEARGGSWDAADNGLYTVCVGEALTDRAGRRPLPECVRGWEVRIAPEPPPSLPVEVSLFMQEGVWRAKVTVENTGGWWRADWGRVQAHGPVLTAFARLEVPPPYVRVMVPAVLEHTYEVGELRPGRYSFVFKSSEGHCAVSHLGVPGVEPPGPLAQWTLNVLGRSGDAGADDDGDGLPAFGEYYLATDPRVRDQPRLVPRLQRGADGEWRAALVFRRVTGADAAVRCLVEVSSDMRRWRVADPQEVEFLPAAADVDGTQEVCVCLRKPLRMTAEPFLRLRLENSASP